MNGKYSLEFSLFHFSLLQVSRLTAIFRRLKICLQLTSRAVDPRARAHNTGMSQSVKKWQCNPHSGGILLCFDVSQLKTVSMSTFFQNLCSLVQGRFWICKQDFHFLRYTQVTVRGTRLIHHCFLPYLPFNVIVHLLIFHIPNMS